MGDKPKSKRLHTTKQMGDACEMLIAAELTLAGVPSLKAPENWPHYDVIAQLSDGKLQRISVKSRVYKSGSAYVQYGRNDSFDWLAIVILPSPDCPERRYYIAPRNVVDGVFSGPKDGQVLRTRCTISTLEAKLGKWRNNFTLAGDLNVKFASAR